MLIKQFLFVALVRESCNMEPGKFSVKLRLSLEIGCFKLVTKSWGSWDQWGHLSTSYRLLNSHCLEGNYRLNTHSLCFSYLILTHRPASMFSAVLLRLIKSQNKKIWFHPRETKEHFPIWTRGQRVLDLPPTVPLTHINTHFLWPSTRKYRQNSTCSPPPTLQLNIFLPQDHWNLL